LLYGVPLEVYVSKFAHMRFEPSGRTNDPDITAVKSIVDYIFRWMGKKWVRGIRCWGCPRPVANWYPTVGRFTVVM
jgi:ribonucleoside-diphosphate reductase alpha chain